MLILFAFPGKLEENVAELVKQLFWFSRFIYTVSLRHKNWKSELSGYLSISINPLCLYSCIFIFSYHGKSS